MPIVIRDAQPSDTETIAEFNARLAAETEDAELDPALIRAGVEALLQDASKGHYWIAEADGRNVGQIMVTREWSDWRNGVMWWIQSVYVHPGFRRKGVFSALYRHVESLARADVEACGIRLYMEKDNLRARQSYTAMGMTMTDYVVMQVEFEES